MRRNGAAQHTWGRPVPRETHLAVRRSLQRGALLSLIDAVNMENGAEVELPTQRDAAVSKMPPIFLREELDGAANLLLLSCRALA